MTRGGVGLGLFGATTFKKLAILSSLWNGQVEAHPPELWS